MKQNNCMNLMNSRCACLQRQLGRIENLNEKGKRNFLDFKKKRLLSAFYHFYGI
jgi:hypothetical protein